MNTEDEIDAQFLSMVSLICNRHNAKFEVDMESRTVTFLTENVSEQLIESIENLYGNYAA